MGRAARRGATRVPPFRSSATGLRALTAAVLVTLLAVAMAGCGAPSYTYAKNSADKTYFKVPRQWHKIDQSALDAALSSDDPDSAAAQLRPKLSWSVAYDAHRSPQPEHLYGLGSDDPFVYAIVRPLSEKEQGALSLDQLRDAFLPVTESSRQQMAQQGSTLSRFELLRDQVLKPDSGFRGVRTTYNYSLPTLPTLQTFDVTAYASDDGRLYVMVLRCSARCYKERGDEMDTIARSFTVRNH
jgi:hypothetical protein